MNLKQDGNNNILSTVYSSTRMRRREKLMHEIHFPIVQSSTMFSLCYWHSSSLVPPRLFLLFLIILFLFFTHYGEQLTLFNPIFLPFFFMKSSQGTVEFSVSDPNQFDLVPDPDPILIVGGSGSNLWLWNSIIFCQVKCKRKENILHFYILNPV